MGNCVTALIRNYQPMMAVLEECAATGDVTAIGESPVNKHYQSCPLTMTGNQGPQRFRITLAAIEEALHPPVASLPCTLLC